MKNEILNFYRLISITTLSIFMILLHGQAQNLKTVIIPWKSSEEVILNGKKTFIPSIENQYYNGKKPIFIWKEKTNFDTNWELLSFSSVEASTNDINYIKNESIEIPNQIEFKSKIVNENNSKFLSFQLFPFVQEKGKIQRITSINIQSTIQKSKSRSTNKSLISHSVLSPGSGKWVKIKIQKSGIYKINKTFLEQCGINTSNLDPKTINIFGNGEGKLPELNSINITDDLAKNSIFINGEADGIFNENDYILFYGWGPTKWSKSSTSEFNYDQNIYSDFAYYFININENESPKRIAITPSSSSSITNNVNTYSYYQNHENDLVSLMKGGQRWYGELFDTELERYFEFNIPNIENSTPVNFKINIASNANSTSGNKQIYSINSTQLFSANLPNSSSDSYGRSTLSFSLNNPSSYIPLKMNITRTSPSILTYLDNIVINARRKLIFDSNQFNFRDLNSIGTGRVSEFTISNSLPSSFVWDITSKQNPIIIQSTNNNSLLSFRVETDSLKEFVASDGVAFYTPEIIGNIAYQDLHGLPQADYLIVSHKEFISQAERLANLHRQNGLLVNVVTTEQIFNEFSSGMLDPTAIKRFAKMFYDRSLILNSTSPKYLLLFGDGTYDPKNRVENNNNYIPTYQSVYSEDPISALVSDDYYGLLDDNESFDDIDLLDIGVGRLLVSDIQMAKQQVDKIEHYMKNGSSLFNNTDYCGTTSSSTFGDWRTNYVLIADDEQNGAFVSTDAEPNYSYVRINHPELNCDKIYLDAYNQISTAGGQRYPDVFNAINEKINSGALVINYIGHGGEVGVAEERVITVPQIQSWNNINKLNLFVSATCEFTKYDDPSRVSAGEWASINPTGASIALMTTTRAIYISINTDILQNFYKTVFERDSNFEPLTFGEIIKRTKNLAYASENKRCFSLIGDPALKIALPKLKIITDSINSKSPNNSVDTLKALSKVTIKGHIEDFYNNSLSNFNGILTPTIYDKLKTIETLGQDVESPVIDFEIQKNALFKGKTSIINGKFEFSFIVPKDINFSYGNGKISYYADNGNTLKTNDAIGQESRFIIGGINSNGVIDNIPPTVKLYINDDKFVDGGITNQTPTLIAKVEDENGINTVGNGIGHDITAIIDGETAKPFILNNYYSANLDSYQKGEIKFTFPDLEIGNHTLSFKIWDVNANSTETSINFIVQEKEEIAISHVLNYPNPFTSKTDFYFEHNQICNELDAMIQIFTISGKLIKTIRQNVNTIGFRSNGITWDGKDEFGDDLAKGVYIYKLTVKNVSGQTAEKLEKLVLLK